MQWNKRDMPDALSMDELNEELNPEGVRELRRRGLQG